jgi:flagellar FliL protein
MARDQNVINLVREHVAVIRNSLILLYSSAVFEEVATRAGKEKMLADGLAEIQKVMAATAGVGGIEAVYFTSLIIQ